MATFLVGAVLLGLVAMIVRSMIRDKKKGKSLQCGGDCGKCGGYCHWTLALKGGRYGAESHRAEQKK